MKKIVSSIIICLSVTLTLVCSCTPEQTGSPVQTPDAVETNNLTGPESTETAIPSGVITITVNRMYPHFSIEDLIKESHAIIIGKVTEVLPPIQTEDPYRPGEKIIYTNVILEVDRYLLGNSKEKQIALCLFGGRVGNTVMKFSDEPVYKGGEEVLLFLRNTDPNYPPPEGFSAENYYLIFVATQGKYRYENGNMIGWDGKISPVAELEQKITEVGGK
jgi:hypothetical protein